VPAPGGQRELEESVAELLTAGVPEDHPPWRVWTVEGLADGAGALIAVVHHALVDGVAGIGLLEHLLRLTPESDAASAHTHGEHLQSVRPKPILERTIERVAADLRGRAAAWRQLTHELDPRQHASTLAALLWEGLHPSSELGLDGRAPSRDRSFAMVSFPLDDAKTIKRTFQVTINDVVVACISGAIRRYVARLGVDPDRLDDVRAMLPVNRHARDEHATSGNRVALLLAKISVDEPDAVRRLRRVAEMTRTLKARDMAGAGDMLVALSNLTWSGVLTNVFRLALWRRAFRLVITNVPGPQVPLYLLDARVTTFAPIVNLWPGTPLAFAIGSYAGMLTITVDADRAAVSDVAPIVEDLGASFAELKAAASPSVPAVVATAPAQAH
jgi:WS/DGAT/MGAT family acyltransferase